LGDQIKEDQIFAICSTHDEDDKSTK